MHHVLIRDKWLRKIPNKNLKITKNTRVCSLHFNQQDFNLERQDGKISRRKKCASVNLQKRYLKPSAVPCIFPNAPKYLSKPSVERHAPPLSEIRRNADSERNDQRCALFLQEDEVNSILNISQKLKSERLPEGFSVLLSPLSDCLLICQVNYALDVPEFISMIKILPNLEIRVIINNILVNPKKYSHIVATTIQRFSQLQNLMAFVKCESLTETDWLLKAVECFNNYLKESSNESSGKKVEFLLDQLKLLRKPKNTRRYSSSLLLMSYCLHADSAVAYNNLRNLHVLTLPCNTVLNAITKRMDPNCGLQDLEYLRIKISKLSQYQRFVTLMIDEIYISKRVEYCGGKIIGLQSANVVANTVLCFMIKSVGGGKYMDVVKLIPMCNLNADKLYTNFLQVARLLRDVGFIVIAISTDNLSANRAFFKLLGNGELTTQVLNPIDPTGYPIFLLFDPTHNIKNIYNNFLCKKSFQCPAVYPILDTNITAKFSDIVDVYEREKDAPLKMAYSLNKKCISPTNIEKLSVKLSMSIFCDLTAATLKFHKKNETAKFIDIILKYWKVLNVKTPHLGKQKRDFCRDPVNNVNDWKIQYLQEFAQFLTIWHESKQPGLTNETFLAVKQTTLALVSLCTFLLSNCGFQYVLLGNMQSDSLEKRFGWYRQLSGGNYYISYRQIIESEKKIKAISMLKFSYLSLQDIDCALEGERSTCSDDFSSCIMENITPHLDPFMQPSLSDGNIIYYVAGYVAHYISKSSKCSNCTDLVLADTDLLQNVMIDYEGLHQQDMRNINPCFGKFLDYVNRGGLKKPNNYIFYIGLKCFSVFEQLQGQDSLMEHFLKFVNHRDGFLTIMSHVLENDEDLGDLIKGRTHCVNGHSLLQKSLACFFNCFAKNFVRRKSDNAIQAEVKRKLIKLSGKTSC